MNNKDKYGNDPRSIREQLEEVGLIVTEKRNQVGKREITYNGEHLGYYFALDALKLIPYYK